MCLAGQGTPAGNTHANVVPAFEFQSCETRCIKHVPRGAGYPCGPVPRRDNFAHRHFTDFKAVILRGGLYKNMYLASYGLVGLALLVNRG